MEVRGGRRRGGGASILRGILEKTSSSNDRTERTLCFHPTSRPNNTGHECFYLQFTDKYSFRGPVSTDPPPIILYSLQDQFCGWCNNPAVILIAHPVSPLVYIFFQGMLFPRNDPLDPLFFQTVKRRSIKRFHFNLLFERNESTHYLRIYYGNYSTVLYVIRFIIACQNSFKISSPLSRSLEREPHRNKNSRLNKCIWKMYIELWMLAYYKIHLLLECEIKHKQI